jgi:hypothetical protein
MAREVPLTVAEANKHCVGRVKSVLVVDGGEVPSSVYQRLDHEGWICGHAPDIRSALVVLHQVRPALVLVGSVDEARDAAALRALRQDPFMAGVPLVLLGGPTPPGETGEIGALAEQLQALMPAR